MVQEILNNSKVRKTIGVYARRLSSMCPRRFDYDDAMQEIQEELLKKSSIYDSSKSTFNTFSHYVVRTFVWNQVKNRIVYDRYTFEEYHPEKVEHNIIRQFVDMSVINRVTIEEIKDHLTSFQCDIFDLLLEGHSKNIIANMLETYTTTVFRELETIKKVVKKCYLT